MPDIVYIDLRDNPGYHYADVLSAINYNFQLVSGGTGGGGSGSTTYVRQGSNITTGGTAVAPIVNVVASPSFNSLSFSGTGQFAVTTSTTFSGGTVSGGTIYSGITNLSTVIINVANAAAGALAGDYTRVQPGSNVTTGGTANAPIISIAASPSLNALTLSGTGQFAGVRATSISGGTVSGGTLYSGSTNLYSIFAGAGTTSLTTGYIAFGSHLNTISGSSLLSYNSALNSVFIGGWTINNTTPTNPTIIAGGTDAKIEAASLTLTTQGGGPNSNIILNSEAPIYFGNGTNPQLVKFGDVSFVPTAWVDAPSSTTAYATLRIRSGETVSAPNDGEIWNDGTHLYGIINGNLKVLEDFLPRYQVAYGNLLSGITGSTNFTYNGTSFKLNVGLGSDSIGVSATGQIDINPNSSVTNLYNYTNVDILSKTSTGLIYFREQNTAALHGDITYSTSATDGLFRWAGKSRFASLSATTLSGGTIYSGTTALSTVIDRYSSRVKAGSNITTGGTSSNQTINTASKMGVDSISFSGSVTGGTNTILKSHYLFLENTRIVGSATLSSGAATVNTSDVNTADSLIFLTVQNLVGPPMAQPVYVNNIVNNTSFQILSPDPGDNSTVAWMIIKY